MSARAMNKRAKEILAEWGYAAGAVLVRRGRGTAWNWLHVYTLTPPSEACRAAVEKKFVEERLCGTFYPDDGFAIAAVPNIQWMQLR